MAKKELEAVEELDEELDELDDQLEVDLEDDAVLEGDEVVAEVEEGEADDVAVTAPRPADDEDDEIPDADDVEASLDVILKERLVVEDEPEDDEGVELDDRGEGNERVLPKQADEFVCNSCFLVKNASQLANKKTGLCRDCA